jgi:hypothetical protein
MSPPFFFVLRVGSSQEKGEALGQFGCRRWINLQRLKQTNKPQACLMIFSVSGKSTS